MLELRLGIAEKFQQAIFVLKDVNEKCWMQIQEHRLVFGAMDEDDEVPAILSLAANGFDYYFLRRNSVEWNVTFRVNLANLNTILGHYGPNHAIIFSITSCWQYARFFTTNPNGEPANPLVIPLVRIPHPFFNVTGLQTMPRPFQYLIDGDWFAGITLMCAQHRLAIFVWRSTVLAFWGNQHRVSVQDMYSEATPAGDYCKFYMSLHSADYTYQAAQVSRWVRFETQDPGVDNTVPPSMIALLDPFTRITFYLPFDSVVLPRVLTQDAYAGLPFPQHFPELNIN